MTLNSALLPFHQPLTGFPGRRRNASQSLVHKLALAFVFLTVASSGFVFSEPAPVDAMTVALIFGLPLIGLVAHKRLLAGYLAVWLVIAASGFLAATLAHDTPRATAHFAISLYLYLAAYTFAGFVALKPEVHTRLILNGYLAAALMAAAAGVTGYFDVLPGSAEIFTRFERASGPFKDPNVFGAFLVPMLVYTVHLWLARPVGRLLPLGAAGGLLVFGILLSFSRGAWIAAALAILIYWYLSFAVAGSSRRRLRLMGLPLIAGVAGIGLLAVALQDPAISKLLAERATLTQSYDEGPEGRFGGQHRALGVIAENPLGIGALEFTPGFHVNGTLMPNRSEGRGFGDDVHNSYLSMFLNAGWIAGCLNVVIVAVTLTLGLRHAFRRTATQPLFIVAYAGLAATLLEGVIIDFDHWRHVHLLLGLVWGLMAGDTRVMRSSRIVADHRPVLMQTMLIIPPSRRQNRIVGDVKPMRPVSRLPRRGLRPVASRIRPKLPTPKPIATMPLDLEGAIARLRRSNEAAEGRVQTAIKGGALVKLGQKIVFEVTSRVPGRLILIDINAAGDVRQILPNPFLGVGTGGLVQPDVPITIPGKGYSFPAFQAVEPTGRGRLISLVVPARTPGAGVRLVESELAKGLEPVKNPAAYLSRLVEHFLALSEDGPVGHHARDLAFAITDYEIAK